MVTFPVYASLSVALMNVTKPPIAVPVTTPPLTAKESWPEPGWPNWTDDRRRSITVFPDGIEHSQNILDGSLLKNCVVTGSGDISSAGRHDVKDLARFRADCFGR